MTGHCKACGRDLVGDACSFCDAEVSVPVLLAPSERVFQCVQRHPGLPSLEIAELLGATGDEELDAITQMLCRLVKRGALRSEGGRGDRTFFAADESLLPRKRMPKEPTSKRKAKTGPKRPRKVKYDHKGLRDRRRAAGLCYGCGAGLAHLEGWTRTRCPECLERDNERMAKYRATEAGRRKSIEYSRKYEQRNAEAVKARYRERYMERKLAGQCAWCVQPADDTGFCAKHYAHRLATARQWHARLRERAKQNGMCTNCGKNPRAGTYMQCERCREMRGLTARAA